MMMNPPFSSPINPSSRPKNIPLLISGCLLGIHCRYDGKTCGIIPIFHMVAPITLVPCCPEQLGGLSTPRLPARIVGGDGVDVLSGKARVIQRAGEDVTDAFKKGAQETLALAQLFGVRIALLKDESPSCGLSTPYCEKAGGIGMGVTAALLDSSGIHIMEINPTGDFPMVEIKTLLDKISM